MRTQGRLRMGYFPLPEDEARRIGSFLRPPDTECSIVDPCAGCGSALRTLSAPFPSRRYGVELDAHRAEQASGTLDQIIHGSAFVVHCPVESFSLLYLNPPYDWECGEGQNARMEGLFLEHCFRWLKVSGVVVLVIPAARLSSCAEVLAIHFRDKALYRLTHEESVKYGQIVIFGVRRSPRERQRLRDTDVAQAKRRLHELVRWPDKLPALPDAPDRVYQLPPSGPVQWVFRGLPVDDIEDLLERSAATRQAARILFGASGSVTGRPLIPLHAGQVGLLAVSGLLNGCFGSGKDRHVACWQSSKVIDRFEDVEDGVTTIRERERFTQTLTLAYADGRTAILTDGSHPHEERTPEAGNPRIHQDDT